MDQLDENRIKESICGLVKWILKIFSAVLEVRIEAWLKLRFEDFFRSIINYS